jgi:hypothetical protein
MIMIVPRNIDGWPGRKQVRQDPTSPPSSACLSGPTVRDALFAGAERRRSDGQAHSSLIIGLVKMTS